MPLLAFEFGRGLFDRGLSPVFRQIGLEERGTVAASAAPVIAPEGFGDALWLVSGH
jgi:hypothetical protein